MFDKKSNAIVIGGTIEEKMNLFFLPQIKSFNKIVVISQQTCIQGLKDYNFQANSLVTVNNTAFANDRILFTYSQNNTMLNNKNLMQLIDIIGTTENILLMLTAFEDFNIGVKILKVLEQRSNINVLLFLDNLDYLRKTYKDIARRILRSCEIVSCKQCIDFSGELRLRLPKELHKQLSIEADCQGVSLNQYLLFLLASRNINTV